MSLVFILTLLMSSFSVRVLNVLVQNTGGCCELDLLPEKNTNESNDLLTTEGPDHNKLSKCKACSTAYLAWSLRCPLIESIHCTS